MQVSILVAITRNGFTRFPDNCTRPERMHQTKADVKSGSNRSRKTAERAEAGTDEI
jgi:hypothetical protein